MADVVNRPASSGKEASTAELVQRATEQITRLIKDELALAKIELTEKGKRAGLGVGLFGGGGVLAFYGFGALVVTTVLLLDLVMPAWLAALIVAVLLFLAAGAFALLGKRQVSQAVPDMTPMTNSLIDDVNTVATAVRDRGRHDGQR